MAVPPDIRDHAYKLFIQEVPDLLQAIESDLLKVAEAHSPARTHNLMRIAHSIKGGAASVGLDVIASLAHRLENIFKALYSDQLKIDTDLESQLLQAYDCLRLPLMQQVATGQFDAEQALILAEPTFAQIEATFAEVLSQIDYYDIPTSAQLGVDMTLTILETDVAEQLERLAAAIATLQVDQVEAELRSQVEIFLELAEILNKPGLGVIAQTVLDAMNAHPEQILQIAPLALSNCQVYQERLLASNGKDEIAPSEDLLAWVKNTAEDALFNPDFNPHYIDQPSLHFSSDSLENAATWLSDLELDPLEDVVEPIERLGEFTDVTGAQEPIAEELLLTLLHEIDTETEAEVEHPSPPADITATLEAIHDFRAEVEVLNTELTPNLSITSSELSDQPAPLHHSSEPGFSSTATFALSEPSQPVSAQIHQQATPIAPLTTRVDSDQLEQMNNLVNEAAIKCSSLSLQNEQIQNVVGGLLSRFSTVEQIVVQLRKVADRTLISNPRSGHGSPLHCNSQALSAADSLADSFDSLELDHYGTLHSLLQRFLEDMIQLRESADDTALFARRSNKNLADLRKALNQLQDDLMWVRMLPVREVLNRFPRILRDLSITYNKPVKLELSGTEVLVDRAVIERLYDPLLHLLRNAFDHGIESPQSRRQQGKPEQGLIQINAFHRAGQIVIEVKDDGAGLNLDRIGQRSIELGLLSAQQLATVADYHLFNLIFEPGFSTASQVSELSGRGVGLDVVRTQLHQLKGTIDVTSQSGIGTTFTLRLPLTLTSDKLLICLAGFTALALPSDSIHEIFVPRADQVIQVGKQEFLQWRKEVFPIYRLTDLLEYAGPKPEAPPLDSLITKSTAEPKPLGQETRTLIVISWRQSFAALEVDQLITEQKLGIKPFGSVIAPPSCLYGCTILADGSVVPVVEGATLIDEALQRNTRRKQLPGLSLPTRDISTQDHSTGSSSNSIDRSALGHFTHKRSTAKILVVDDAVALRQTLALALENSGYQVLQAGDGWEAIRQLQFNPDTALVISDIEMPNMNGFDFMNYRRQEATLEEIPLVILTSRNNDKHRRLAMHLGAIAYFTKPYLEKNLLQEIQNILSQNQH